MKKEKEVKISYWAHHLTTIVSVTLVLLLMGITALIWISADSETRRLKEKIELSVIMRDSVPAGATEAIVARLKSAPYAQNVRLITKEEALSRWTADTGENLEEMFGVNPLSEEVTFGVKADYASARSISRITGELQGLAGVETVSSPDAEMIESMNRNIQRMTLILGVVVAIMLLISFVLINNTVHLTIYSRRFTIHTMKLVGATNGFIRRPVILNNMFAGLIAGLVASAIMALAMVGAKETGLPDVASYVGWPAFGVVAASLTVVGLTLCALASCVSANTYLRKDYGQLFR